MTERINPDKISDEVTPPINDEKKAEKPNEPEKSDKKKVDMPVYTKDELDELFNKPYGKYWY
ncbi:MAG TPA: hypothetical protein VLE44_02495 [Candidatus Saccharimonadales bacterium]|nr:hypothetical protein [Candidatus Saccharimonadales bacterium]